MVMLKNVPITTYPFHENTSACCRCFFMPLAGNQKRLPAFSIIFYQTGGKPLKNNEQLTSNRETAPTKKKFHIHYSQVLMGLAAFAYMFALQTNQVLAADMWTKAETIMKDVYGKILGISTIAAIVTASVALLLMNFSKSGKTVDESRAWLKRIAISWVILNGLGFILAYVSPFFADGKWNG